MATHSIILVWRIAGTKEPGYNPWGCKESDTAEAAEHARTQVLSRHNDEKWKCNFISSARCTNQSLQPLFGGLLSNTHPSVFIFSLRNSFVIPSWTWVQGSKIKSIIIRILGKNRRHSLQYSFHPFGADSYYSNLSSHTRVDNRISEIQTSQIGRALS